MRKIVAASNERESEPLTLYARSAAMDMKAAILWIISSLNKHIHSIIAIEMDA